MRKAKSKAKILPDDTKAPEIETPKPKKKTGEYRAVMDLMNTANGDPLMCKGEKDFAPTSESIVPSGTVIKLEPESKRAKRLLAIGAIREI